MQIIIVDDEQLALNNLVRILNEAQPGSAVHPFNDPAEALDYVEHNPVDLAFLDIEMYDINGIELAKQLKDIKPLMNIIFVTGYSDYALDAFSLHASGYLLKPASLEQVKSELANLRAKPEQVFTKNITVHTFGNFEVFYHHSPLDFNRRKSKELLAYLIDRKGAGCTTAELCAILWEDKEYSISLQKQFQTIVSDLLKTLREIREEHIIIKKRNFFSIDTAQIDCDYYQFLKGDIAAINAYTGEYMSNYSWAEFTTGFLYRKLQK